MNFTESEYGFIGERLIDINGSPYLQTHAITNISWNDEIQQFFALHSPSGLAFHNNQTLFGHTVLTSEVVIANDPATDKRSGHVLPDGHPPLRHYLGLPIFCGTEFVGMAGLANRRDGYSQELVDELGVLMNTLGFLIKAYQQEKQRKFAEAKLMLQSRELLEANKAKTRFLASILREIRTPLNAVIGFSKRMLAKSNPEPNDKQAQRNHDSLEAIHRNGKYLLSIVNDLLDVAKIEAGRVELEISEMPLKPLMEDVQQKVLATLQHHSAVLKVHCPEHASIYADALRLEQIVINLVVNAIKYGNGEVDLLVEKSTWMDKDRELKGWRIDVQDNGDGISKEDLDLLFKPYSQLRSEHQKSGTGLGLYIC